MSNLRISGVIQAKNPNGRSFKLDNGEWYGCFTPAMLKAEVGDFVNFAYVDKEKDGRTYHNVSGVVTASSGGAPSTTPNNGSVSTVQGNSGYKELMLPVLLTRERNINRQSSLATAVAYCEFTMNNGSANGTYTIDEVIQIAREFEAYVSGDADIEAAKAALSQESITGAE